MKMIEAKTCKTCKECGMIFVEPVDEKRTTHHIWRFHKDLYEEGVKKTYRIFGNYFKENNSFQSVEELRDYSELEMINYDLQMMEEQR